MPEELKRLIEEIDAKRLENERKREVLLEENKRKWWEENGVD